MSKQKLAFTRDFQFNTFVFNKQKKTLTKVEHSYLKKQTYFVIKISRPTGSCGSLSSKWQHNAPEETKRITLSTKYGVSGHRVK